LALFAFRFAGLFARLALAFPIFMSSCGLGGVLNIRRAICSVASSRSGFGALVMSDQPLPDKFEVQDDIPEPYLAAIGKVVVNWCNVEEVVDLAIAKLAAFNVNDPRGVIVTAHMSWPQKMDVFEALVDALKTDHPDLAVRFEAAKPLLTKAQKGRNRMLHGQWGFNEKVGGVYKLRVSARGKLKYAIEPVSLDDIKTIALEIGAAGLAGLKVIIDD
jgi:hypothetical protein